MGTTDLYQDIHATLEKFPKLEHQIKNGIHSLEGVLDICDTTGNYRGAFDIEILFHPALQVVPIVVEKSNFIPRKRHRHISKEGVCCLDIDHKLLYLARKGFKLVDFVSTKVYPFFANQIYFEDNCGKFANGEYSHDFVGVIEFYKEDLKLFEPSIILNILECICTGKTPKRYDHCICGSKKRYDKCHLYAVDFLETLNRDRLQKDIEGFKEQLTSSLTLF